MTSTTILPSTSADSRVSSIGSTSGRFKISSSREFHVTTTSSSRHTSPIIIELGSSSIKVGISGEAQPRCIFPSTSKIDNGGVQEGGESSSFIVTPPLPYSSIIEMKSQEMTMGGSAAKESSSETPTLQNNDFTQFHKHLSPFFHNLFTFHLHLKPKSRRVIILMPIHYPQSYKESIQSILLDELKIPALKFVNGSGLYTTIPYGLGKNTGLVVDFGSVECSMGAFFNRDVVNDTVTIVPVGRETLIQNVCNEYELQKTNGNEEKSSDDDLKSKMNNIEDIVAIIEDILMNHQSGIHKSRKDLYDEVNKITKEYIEDYYFNIDNPHSLVYAFLTCLLKCPIDLRVDIVRNVCFIGDGVSYVPNIERRFLSCIQGIFQKKESLGGTEENKVVKGVYYSIKDSRHKKFQTLATLLLDKGPLSLIYPLPYDPSCISWVGGSVYGCLNLSNDSWVQIDNSAP